MTEKEKGSYSIYTMLGASNHTDKEREKDDYYATSPIAIDKLLSTGELTNNTIWECACGEGHLAKRLQDYGFNVLSTDLIDRGFGDIRNLDFISIEKPIRENVDILTNPPYKFAKEFVLKALELLSPDRKCFMFLKLQFLEGKARFKELFSKFPPKTIYVFSSRVLCAKNANFKEMEEAGGSAVAYAWYVWEKGYEGATTLQWLC